MKRILVMLAVVALLMVALAAPAFAQANRFKECGSFSDEGFSFEFCDHGVRTPSGNENYVFRSKFTEEGFGTGRSTSTFHFKPAR